MSDLLQLFQALAKERDALKADNASLQQLHDTHLDTIQQLNTKHATLTQQLKLHDIQHNKHLNELKHKIHKTETENKTLKDKLNDATKDLKIDNEHLKQHIDSLTANMAKQTKLMDNSDEQIGKLQQRIAQLEEILENERKEREVEKKKYEEEIKALCYSRISQSSSSRAEFESIATKTAQKRTMKKSAPVQSQSRTRTTAKSRFESAPRFPVIPPTKPFFQDREDVPCSSVIPLKRKAENRQETEQKLKKKKWVWNTVGGCAASSATESKVDLPSSVIDIQMSNESFEDLNDNVSLEQNPTTTNDGLPTENIIEQIFSPKKRPSSGGQSPTIDEPIYLECKLQEELKASESMTKSVVETSDDESEDDWEIDSDRQLQLISKKEEAVATWCPSNAFSTNKVSSDIFSDLKPAFEFLAKHKEDNHVLSLVFIQRLRLSSGDFLQRFLDSPDCKSVFPPAILFMDFCADLIISKQLEHTMLSVYEEVMDLSDAHEEFLPILCFASVLVKTSSIIDLNIFLFKFLMHSLQHSGDWGFLLTVWTFISFQVSHSDRRCLSKFRENPLSRAVDCIFSKLVTANRRKVMGVTKYSKTCFTSSVVEGLVEQLQNLCPCRQVKITDSFSSIETITSCWKSEFTDTELDEFLLNKSLELLTVFGQSQLIPS